MDPRNKNMHPIDLKVASGWGKRWGKPKCAEHKYQNLSNSTVTTMWGRYIHQVVAFAQQKRDGRELWGGGGGMGGMGGMGGGMGGRDGSGGRGDEVWTISCFALCQYKYVYALSFSKAALS